jgi:hypothetical protein
MRRKACSPQEIDRHERRSKGRIDFDPQAQPGALVKQSLARQMRSKMSVSRAGAAFAP